MSLTYCTHCDPDGATEQVNHPGCGRAGGAGGAAGAGEAQEEAQEEGEEGEEEVPYLLYPL